MFNSNCNCQRSGNSLCTLLAFGISAIIGVITTLLVITATITVTPAFLWVLLGIAVVYLAVNLIVASTFKCRNKCRCAGTPLTLILVGILGTILLSIVLLAITFPATSVIGAIIVGLLLFFFFLFITATTCLIRCLYGNQIDDFDDICA